MGKRHFCRFVNTNRPYDGFLSSPALKRALQLRMNPDGKVHDLSHRVVAGKRLTIYPWSKMELGDMFFVPVNNRSLTAMRVSFSQAAARHDFEICVIGVGGLDGIENLSKQGATEGVEYLRVSVSAVGVNEAKRCAYRAGLIPHAPPIGIEDRVKARKGLKLFVTKGPETKELSTIDEKTRAVNKRRAKRKRELRATRKSPSPQQQAPPPNPFDDDFPTKPPKDGPVVYTDAAMTREQKVAAILGLKRDKK